ncbi:MAG: sulfatase [Armatimonadetes bacterium]|nr:sulfatase [Armatimonadota bacterium]MDI9583756.1 sulfatase [Acidobacteriota bacterium]
MNFVILMLDSLRPDHLGCLGSPDVKTPHLDRFAAQSVVFETAYAEFPNTIPSRTAFVSGMYTFPCRPWQALEPDDLHVAEILRGAGYHTAALSDTPFNNGAHMDRGFDEFRHFPMGKCLPPADGRDLVDISDAFFPPGYPEKEVLYYAKTMTNRALCLEKHGVTPGEYFFDEVSNWLRQDHSAPFFLWVDSFQPHEPWEAGEPYRSMYEPRFGYEGRYLPMPMAPDSDKWMMPGDIEHVRALYKASVTETDDYVGRVLGTIDECGLAEDTVVMILSDHGMPLGEHGLVRKFGYPVYDELARIVWMMRVPGARVEGARSSALVSNVDFLPTLLAIAGIEIDTALPGHDIMQLARGEKASVRENLYLGAYNYRTGVRTATHKFIDNRGEKDNELFDMVADPAEQHNIAEDNPELAHELHRRIWDFHEPWKVKMSRHHKAG